MITSTLRPITKNEYYIVLDPIDTSIVFLGTNHVSDWIYINDISSTQIQIRLEIIDPYRIFPPVYYMRGYPSRRVIGLTTEPTMKTVRKLRKVFPEHFI